MEDEISNAIRDQSRDLSSTVDHDFEKAAMAVLKSKHRHSDGTEPILTPIEESNIERKIIQDE